MTIEIAIINIIQRQIVFTQLFFENYHALKIIYNVEVCFTYYRIFVMSVVKRPVTQSAGGVIYYL